MKHKIILTLIAIIFIIISFYFFVGYISSYFGWYGYKKWEHRNGTTSIQESKKRGVFVRNLNYTVDFSDSLYDFIPYIERGFKYGLHSSTITETITQTKYPYQLAFNNRPTDKITISIKKEDLLKFDSSNANWGYLKSDVLPDTIILTVNGYGMKSGIIKVW
jgi:hypothetical protein